MYFLMNSASLRSYFNSHLPNVGVISVYCAQIVALSFYQSDILKIMEPQGPRNDIENQRMRNGCHGRETITLEQRVVPGTFLKILLSVLMGSCKWLLTWVCTSQTSAGWEIPTTGGLVIDPAMCIWQCSETETVNTEQRWTSVNNCISRARS